MPEIDKSSPILREDHKIGAAVVFVHVHYADVWEAMAAQVAACMPGPFRLVLTSSLPPRSLAVPPTPLLLETRIIETENRGRDIRPFLTALGQTDDFSIGLKLHSKRSTHRLDGDKWRESIVNSLLPSRQGVTAIIDAMADDPRIGLVAPQGGLLSIRPWIGRNEPGMRAVASRIELELADRSLRDGHFVAGSMFWFRRDAVADFTDLQLLPLFETEAGQVDGTLAHAAERLFALVAETRGCVTLPVDALPDAHPDMTLRELQALSRSTVDRDNPHLRPLPLLFRTVDRYLPFAKTVYGRLHPGIRGAVRKLLLRGPSSGIR
jgi:lipopolysaccharide biosynthesis protein